MAQPMWSDFHGCCSVAGDRDFFLLTSEGEIKSPDVIPRRNVDINDEDRRRLENHGIPAHCCDDRSIIKARVKKDESLELVGEVASRPGRELSRSYVLQQLQQVLTRCRKVGGMGYCSDKKVGHDLLE